MPSGISNAVYSTGLSASSPPALSPALSSPPSPALSSADFVSVLPASPSGAAFASPCCVSSPVSSVVLPACDVSTDCVPSGAPVVVCAPSFSPAMSGFLIFVGGLAADQLGVTRLALHRLVLLETVGVHVGVDRQPDGPHPGAEVDLGARRPARVKRPALAKQAPDEPATSIGGHDRLQIGDPLALGLALLRRQLLRGHAGAAPAIAFATCAIDRKSTRLNSSH